MSAFHTYDDGLGGPGIWDQMPLVPPRKAPPEVEDSGLIWSKPKPSTPSAQQKATPSKRKATTKGSPKKKAKKKTARSKAAKKRSKKTAGRSKRR